MNLQLGFSTGCIRREGLGIRQMCEFFRKLGCPAIELMFSEADDILSGGLERIKQSDVDGFDYVSLHAPTGKYALDSRTRDMLDAIYEAHRRLNFNLVVFHPDKVSNFILFVIEHRFPVAFENMDSQKEFGRWPGDMEEIFGMDDPNPVLKMVLDVNHVYTNDASMILASDFYDLFGDKIVEIHLSGFSTRHDPLFKTRQTQIISAIQSFDIPIIVESKLKLDEVEQERDYILSEIKKIPKPRLS